MKLNPLALLTQGLGLNTVLEQPAGHSLTTPQAGLSGLNNVKTLAPRVAIGSLQSFFSGQGPGAGAAHAMGGRLGTGLSQDPDGMAAMSKYSADRSDAVADAMGKVRDQNAFSELKHDLEAGVTKLTVTLGTAIASQISKEGDAVKQMYAQ